MKTKKDRPNGLTLAQVLRDLAAKKQAERAKNPPPPLKKKTKTGPKPIATWQLPNDEMLRLFIEPSPPRPGSARLKVEITAFEATESFEGTLAYRITKTQQSSAAWIPLRKTGEDENCSVLFEFPLTLAKGAVYVQFRLHGAGEENFKREFTDLTDWQLKVK